MYVHVDLMCCGCGCCRYEEQALVYSLQGLVNRAEPVLFFDTGAKNFDYPQSDKAWVQLQS